ncbi:MAG TPA: sugar ABC transporter permease [Chloroflexota bacterium]|jgi:multiple sugar transport system permease protein|nr:sugar ABC transporter permease [Chloroflexota bacterium]
MTTTAVAAPAARRGWHRRRYLWGYLFISPWLIGFVVFTAGPFLASLLLSLTNWEIVGTPSWVGLSNYERIFTRDARFTRTLGNTAYYVLFHVPGVNLLALACALLLNQKLRGIAVYRTLFYMPSVTSGVATAVLWIWVFNGQYGVLNSFLGVFGISGPNWLFDFNWSMNALIIMSLWGMGNAMLIYLAGLQNVPQHLYEAALVDGASYVDIYRRIVLPLSRPILVTITAFSFIAHWNDFFGPLIYLNSPKQMTLAVGLLFFKSDTDSLVHLLLAASVITLLPIVIVFLLAQRYFVSSIMMTGLKEG